MAKKPILDDLKRIAAKLKTAPSRDEYRQMGSFSEWEIRKEFGTFKNAVTEAGLLNLRLNVLDADGFKLAQMTEQIKGLNQYIKELENDALTATNIRKLIGAADTTKLGEGADWIKGPRSLASGLTGIPTLIISDIHFDEVVRPEQINYVNEYNHEIACERIRQTFTSAVDLTKKYLAKPRYDGFILALGGDLLSGNIHEELAETNEQSINKSILDLTDLLAQCIGWLADEFGKVFVPCVVGNHGRHHRKPRYKYRVEHNHEWLIYQYLARHFKNDRRVSFFIPDGPDAQWTCYGRTYNLNHGDQFKGGTGIAGLFSPLMLGMARKQKKQNAIGQPFDVMINGHWHQYIHTESLIVNGSIKGYDEFADAHNFPFEPPQQALFVSHPVKRDTFRMPVWCDKDPRQVGNKNKKSVLTW